MVEYSMNNSPGDYIDIVFEVANKNAFYTVMDTTGWSGWLTAADVADPDDTRVEGFNRVRVGEILEDNLWYIRCRQWEWDALSPKPGLMLIIEERDPFVELVFQDKLNPTEAELNLGNVWWWIAQDDDKVNAVRRWHPREVDDGDGGIAKQGLRTGAFDARFPNFKGVNELSV